MRHTRSRVSVSTRLPAGSMNVRFQPGWRRRDGSDLQSGDCSGTRRTAVGHVMARPSFVHASELHDLRQDQLDAVVWKELMRLLEDPHIIRDELNRRLEVANNADP